MWETEQVDGRKRSGPDIEEGPETESSSRPGWRLSPVLAQGVNLAKSYPEESFKS